MKVVNQKIRDYAEYWFKRGYSPNQIKQALIGRGIPTDEVNVALGFRKELRSSPASSVARWGGKERKTSLWIIGLIGIIAIILILLFAVSYWNKGNGVPGEKIPTINYVQYSNPSMGISMDYPSQWELKEESMGGSVTFRSPAQGEADFIERLKFTSSDAGGGEFSIDEISRSIIDEWSSKGNGIIEDFRLEINGDTSIGGVAGKKITGFGTDAQTQTGIKLSNILVLKGDRFIVIEYRIEQGEENTFVPLFDRMVGSIVFLPDGENKG